MAVTATERGVVPARSRRCVWVASGLALVLAVGLLAVGLETGDVARGVPSLLDTSGAGHASGRPEVDTPEPPRVRPLEPAHAFVALEVVDRRTSAALSQGELAGSSATLADQETALSSSARWKPSIFDVALSDDGRLPARLPVADDDRFLWLDVPGYESRALHVTPDQRSVRVELDPVGGLRIEFSGECEVCDTWDADLYLEVAGDRLYTPTHRDSGFTFDLSRREVVIPDLPTGRYRVSVHAPGARAWRCPMYRAEVDVAASLEASCKIDLEHPSGRCGGLRLIVNNVGAVPLDAMLTDELAVGLIPDESGALNYPITNVVDTSYWAEVVSGYSWEAHLPHVAPGTYSFVLRPFGREVTVVVTTDDEAYAFFEVDSLCDVHVEVTGSGLRDGSSRLVWGYVGDDDALRTTVPLHPPRLDAPDRTGAHLRCAARPIWLQVIGPTCSSEYTVLTPDGDTAVRAVLPCEERHVATADVVFIPRDTSTNLFGRGFLASIDVREASTGARALYTPWAARTSGWGVGAIRFTVSCSEPGDYVLRYAHDTGVRTVALEASAGGARPVVERL